MCLSQTYIHCITSVSDAAKSLLYPERDRVRESVWPLLSVSVSVFCPSVHAHVTHDEPLDELLFTSSHLNTQLR